MIRHLWKWQERVVALLVGKMDGAGVVDRHSMIRTLVRLRTSSIRHSTSSKKCVSILPVIISEQGLV